MKIPRPERWVQLSPMLDELLDLPEPAQAARLAAIRADAPGLGEELAALLADGQKARSVGFLSGALSIPAAVAPETSLVGQRLGPYVLEAPLGQGGMGSVWRARREDGRFESAVAVKLLHLSLLGQAGAERFRREGNILARLAHPNIAHLLDAGVTPSGQPYLVIELVTGERIDRHCDAQRLGIEARLAIFDDVLSAVAHAHSHLVIHRDIKPGNILVTADGSVKLLDFGIAKLLQDETQAAEATELTREGGRALTPEYAAPEQLRGQAVTTATDVYALGVLLFQLLAGRHPTAPATGTAAEVVQAALETEAARLSRAVTVDFSGAPRSPDIAASRDSTPQRLRRALEGDLENIVARALRKSPADRYGTVAAFAEDLRRHLAHEPVSARPDSISYRARKFVQRHRVAVAGGFVLGLAITAGVIGTVTQAQRAAEQARVAAGERDRAVRELTVAEATSEFMNFLLSEGHGKPFTAAELLGRAEQLVERQFSTSADLRARLSAIVAGQFATVDDTSRADSGFQRALQAASTTGDSLLIGDLQCRQGNQMRVSGHYDEARKLINEGLGRLHAAAEADAGDVANCLSSRAKLRLEQGDARAALVDAEQALALLNSPRPGQRLLVVDIRGVLADSRARLGDYPRAIADYEAELAELVALGREQTSIAVVVENNLGVILLNAGLLGRASQILEQSRTTAIRAVGDLASNPVRDTNLAGAWLELGRVDEAVQTLEQALNVARQSGNQRFIGFISAKAAAGWCVAGDAARCADRLSSAKTALTAILPPGHSAFGTIELTAARLSLLKGEPEAARRQLQHALELYDAAPERNPVNMVARGMLSRLEQRLGHGAEALALSERAVADARLYTAGLPASEWLGSALLSRANVLEAQSELKVARSTAQEALTQLRGSLGAGAPATREATAMLDRL